MSDISSNEVIKEAAASLLKGKIKIQSGHTDGGRLINRMPTPTDFQGGTVDAAAFDIITDTKNPLNIPLGPQMRAYMSAFQRALQSNSTEEQTLKAANEAWRTNTKNKAYKVVLGRKKRVIFTDALYEAEIPNSDAIILLFRVLLHGDEKLQEKLFAKAKASNLNPLSWFIQHIHLAMQAYAREYAKKLQITPREEQLDEKQLLEYEELLSNFIDGTSMMLLENIAMEKNCTIGEVICHLIPLL